MEPPAELATIKECLTTPKTPVCLTMIVKNEEHCIARALKSAAPFITCYSIADTGSTDRTKEVIRETAAELGIPGQVVDVPWKDFGHNRSEALRHARLYTENKGWSWMLDADDSIQCDAEDLTKELNNMLGLLQSQGIHAIQLIIKEPSGVYNRRIQVFNNDFQWAYKGVLHEYPVMLDDKNAVKEGKLGTMPEVLYHKGSREGARNIDPQKYSKDAAVLLKALEDNPKDPRSRFYLAQSYRDAGMIEKAKKHYLKRAEMKEGWSEERYISYMNLIQFTDDIDDKVRFAYKAAEINPHRLECATLCMAACRVKDIWRQDVWALAMVSDNYDIQESYLFADPNIYKWRFNDEAGIYGYWTNHPLRALEFMKKALEHASDEAQKERIQKNIDAAERKIKS
jgi:glycosyltransferase involved in cell wall biosynthesis